MSGVNKVIIVGYLGQDPQSRSFQNGGKVVNLRIATSETWKDRNTGEKRERTEWHTVAIFNEGIANNAEKYLRKGSRVYVEGKLQTRKWQDQNGQDRYTTEIVLQGFDGTLVFLTDGGTGIRFEQAFIASSRDSTDRPDAGSRGIRCVIPRRRRRSWGWRGRQAPSGRGGWLSLLEAWSAAGFAPDQFWTQTPRTFQAVMRGYIEREKRDHRSRAWLASRIGWLAQVDPRKQPSILSIAGEKDAPADPMTKDEIVGALRAWVVATNRAAA